jgi:hypothetical protein
MSERPVRRVQLKRTKGWRMPPNTVKVDRTTKWGNPWSVAGVRAWLKSVNIEDSFTDRERSENCAHQFDALIMSGIPIGGQYTKIRDRVLSEITELRGKNVACWCKLDWKCHADTLLKVANMTDEELSALRRPVSIQDAFKAAASALGQAIDNGSIQARRAPPSTTKGE